jgi:hypothetical protein
MDNARLNDRLRKDSVNRFRKALESVDDGDQNHGHLLAVATSLRCRAQASRKFVLPRHIGVSCKKLRRRSQERRQALSESEWYSSLRQREFKSGGRLRPRVISIEHPQSVSDTLELDGTNRAI